MSGALLLTLLLWASAIMLGIAAFFLPRDAYDDISLGSFVLYFLAICCLLFAIIFPAVTFGGRAVGRTTCRNWGSQVGVPVEFRVLNWADTGTCFARTPGGRWIPNSNWFSYVRGGK